MEVSVWVMSLVLYGEVMGVVDVRVLLVLAAARAVLAFLSWRRSLADVRVWQASEGFDAQLLKAADRAFEGFYRRFGVNYALGWVAVVLIAVVLGALGFPEPLSVGAGERLAGLLGMTAMGLGIGSVMRPFCDAYLRPARAEIGAAFVEHELGARAEENIGRRLLYFNVAIVAAVFLVLFGLIVLGEVQAERARVETELKGRAIEQALRLDAGSITAAELGADAEIVGQADVSRRFGVVDLPSEGAVRRTLPGEGLVMAAAPVGDGRWVLVQASPEQDLVQTTLGTLVFLVFMLTLIGLANTMLNQTVTGPIEELDDAVSALVSEGDLRALVRVVPLTGDEVGKLTTNFNRLLDTFATLAKAATEVAEGDLRVELEGPGDLQDAFRGMLARLHEMVAQVRRASLQLAESAAEIQAAAAAQEQSVEQHSQRVLMFSQAVSSLASSAEKISETAGEVLTNAEQTLATTNEMAGEIHELDAQARSVGELLEIIREIADRSDLLALNGSLEATRAGEAGRGFALVAGEMRRLAERVTGAVETVRERLGSISAAGASTVAATDRSRKLANETAAAARQISTITQDQSTETEQLSVEVHEVANVVNATVASTTQTQTAARGLHQQAAELERLISQFKLREGEREVQLPSELEGRD